MSVTVARAVDGNGATRPVRTRVLVVDDHDGFRAQLRGVLDKAGIDVVGEARSGAEALELVEKARPDVVVMDLHMPGMDGFEATRRLAAAKPPVRVVVLTISDRDDDVIRAVLAGASGYLLKDGSLPDLLRGIEAVHDGDALVSPRITAKLLRQLRRTAPAEPVTAADVSELSGRELQVLRLLANGKENAEIASQLHISPKTVKNHISSILMKLRIENRIQAAIYAIRNGIA
jgi:DNA-binding NarL/FixJ family response regulator